MAISRPSLRLLAAFALTLCGTSLAASATTVRHQPWGVDPNGNPVELYTLEDGQAKVSLATYGARIVSIWMPDRNGKLSNVVISRDAADQYTGPFAVTGATIGRYANRIAGASFTLAGTTYTLSKNNGPNTLHGGADGFNHHLWTAKQIKDGVTMSFVSPKGDMGFPGQLTVQVSFTLEHRKKDAALRIAYTAVTTKPTVLNLTNHTYFNLADDPSTPVLQDTATIHAESYTPVSATGIPTGAIVPVDGTPLDFRRPRSLGDNIPDRGYDNNFVLGSHTLQDRIAEVDDPLTGRFVQVYTSEPGLQLFVPHTAPPAAGAAPPAGPPRPQVQAFCLETQHYPDSPHQPAFPSTVLEPGQTFHSETIYLFGVSPTELH